MAKVIASTYEIIKQIGSGGGGNVYLAQHERLGKLVVLKADKRRITTRPELLRREVDILKDLRHSYIPQVYDYFAEDDITYTVMDFIEGESLDKPLKRGEQFSQAQIIKWAKQLLEALCYLHSPVHGNPPRGYVHSDIKPANLMRTPQDDICLIDFNIALALGEENVVGHSEGYASPEHYGLDYSILGGEQTSREAETDKIYDTEATETLVLTEETETIDGETETVIMQNAKQGEKGLSSNSSSSSCKKVVPDVRSDIYSVGATLYHLLSGRRPAKYADKVVRLSEKQFNPQVVRIITRAMSPNPDLRYQTAEEMLQAFRSLRENDSRTKQWKRQNKIACIAFGLMLCAGIITTFAGLKRMQITEKNQKLAEYSGNALVCGDVSSAIQYALDAIPEKENPFMPEYSAEAQKALTNALGVYDLEDGFKKYGVIELDKNPLELTVSPDGNTAACMCENEIVVIDTQTLEKKVTLKAADSAMSELEFLNNEILIYAGEEGVCAYHITDNTVLWTGEEATAVSISGDGNTVAVLYKDNNYAVIYDGLTGEKIKEINFEEKKQQVSLVSDSFANPYGNLFELSQEGRYLAVSFSDGSLDLFDIYEENELLPVLEKKSGYTYFEGGFFGSHLAFVASGKSGSVFAVIDAEKGEQTVGLGSENSFHVKANERGIIVQLKNLLVRMDPVTGEQFPLVETEETIDGFSAGDSFTAVSIGDKIQIFNSDVKLVTQFENTGQTGLLQTVDNIVLSGRIDTPELCLMKYEEHSQKEFAGYDSSFEHDEARVSADGKHIMLFSYKHFAVYDTDGNVIVQEEFPDPESIYDQQFVREDRNSYLEVTYSDGTVLLYDAENGELISKFREDAPDMELNEVFYTDEYRIEAPLHEKPQVYDIESGKRISELDEDAFLIYVTQMGDNIVAQYVTAEGFCYGVLLDNKCREIAYLPYLSDVKDGELYFDYPSAGSLRRSEIYDLDSLIALAKEQIDTNI